MCSYITVIGAFVSVMLTHSFFLEQNGLEHCSFPPPSTSLRFTRNIHNAMVAGNTGSFFRRLVRQPPNGQRLNSPDFGDHACSMLATRGKQVYLHRHHFHPPPGRSVRYMSKDNYTAIEHVCNMDGYDRCMTRAWGTQREFRDLSKSSQASSAGSESALYGLNN